MADDNVEIVRGAYDDFNSGNVGGVIGRLAPDVEWTEPGGGNSPSGTFNGPESVGSDVFSAIPENFDDFRCEVEDLTADGDTVVAKGRFKGKAKSGAELDSAFTHTYELKDGKVTKLNNEVDDNWAEAWS
jgi:ketosteroid isomerase-like protein